MIPSILGVPYKWQSFRALMAIVSFLIFLVPVALCALGAFFVTNTICQNRWKEKIPQAKLVAFAALFTIVFVTLCIFMLVASTIVFGR